MDSSNRSSGNLRKRSRMSSRELDVKRQDSSAVLDLGAEDSIQARMGTISSRLVWFENRVVCLV